MHLPGGPAGDRARAHVLITGLVQGVYFRASTAEEARSLGLAGWVRNTAQGVEAVFEGSASTVEQAIAWCHHGPSRAQVDDVAVDWTDPEGLTGFQVRY